MNTHTDDLVKRLRAYASPDCVDFTTGTDDAYGITIAASAEQKNPPRN